MDQVERNVPEPPTPFGRPLNGRLPDADEGAASPRPTPASLEERLARLQDIFNAAPVGLCCLDLDYRYITVNQCFARMFDLPVEHFIGRTVREAVPAFADQVIDHLDRSLELQGVVEVEITAQIASPLGKDHPSRQLIYRRSAQPMRDASGTIDGFSVAVIDITERKLAEAARRESEDNFRYTVELNPHVLFTTDTDGKRTYVSPRFLELTGLTCEQAERQQWRDSIHPDDLAATAQARLHSLQSGQPYDQVYRLLCAGSFWRWVRVRVRPRHSDQGRVVRWYGTIEDIHENKLRDDALRLKTEHLEEATRLLTDRTREDHLTGLANRRHFDQALLQEEARALRAGQPLALIMIDVDHFKRFNDTYGHLAGDACLRALAQALGNILRRQGDLVARYGGEEFVVLLPDTSEDGAAAVAQHALAAVRELAMAHAASDIGFVTISAGLAVFEPVKGEEFRSAAHAANLIQWADKALYAAKTGGRNRVVNAKSLPTIGTHSPHTSPA